MSIVLNNDGTSQGQFRIRKLQVFNWGTFSGVHEIPIAGKGFLFVGRSGSGKSTLLDAFSALLIPPKWIDFNAAAREAERSGRDRNILSYLRGAWAEQKDDDSGEIATRYLRTATTWAALALTYSNSLGEIVTLVELFWIRGTSNSSDDVKRYYLVFERSFELQELKDFDLDVRKLKQSFPEAFIKDEFRPYCERFSRLLGIENEMALRLLHKTQSAKNLGDLNAFLRDFMLDKPPTFEVAERLVNEFVELNAAHEAVVTARQQVETLTPARTEYQRLQTIQANRVLLDTLRLCLDSYREMRRISLLDTHIGRLRLKGEKLSAEEGRHREQLSKQQSMLRDLEEQHRDAGGAFIERCESERELLEVQRVERGGKRELAQKACSQLGWTLPQSSEGFADLVSKAREEVESWPQQHESLRDDQFNINGQLRQLEQEFADVRTEIEELKRQPSNIPAQMLGKRRDISVAIGIPESLLPFVGELVEVRSDEAAWQGAIERVLHGFALSMLVDEQHYSVLSSYVNSVDLRARLVYFRTTRVQRKENGPLMSNSLVTKLKVKDGQHADWLNNELRQHFDYSCVDSIQSFRNSERALTIEGQVRGKSRHEKDDRTGVNDKRYWVLGFDNREKRLLYEKQAQSLATRIAEMQLKARRLREQELQRASRLIQCQTLVNLRWHEINIAETIFQIAQLDEQLRSIREQNPTLREIGRLIAAQREAVGTADEVLRGVRVSLQATLNGITESQTKLDALREDPTIVPPTAQQAEALAGRFALFAEPESLDNLDKLTTAVLKGLNAEDRKLSEDASSCTKLIEDRLGDFKRRWPTDAADMDGSIRSGPDFFSLLLRLEQDGLPAHEHRFFELLRNQSHQNLAALSTHLSQARKSILERMELVNESLSQVQFNPGTFLHIDASDRQLPEVRQFKQDLQLALSQAWTEDRIVAEASFVLLRDLVKRLASQEPDQRKWREAVLDVRYHVEFIGSEFDSDGKQIEVYRSGAGKSGGQRQKLATTCLAAALRYQLGGNETGVPTYAPVVLDEAFDKADDEFTALSMNIFANFGFQMIVATPLKSVMTLEPFIGGACFIEIAERRRSGTLLIEYDDDRQRLNLPERARVAVAQ